MQQPRTIWFECPICAHTHGHELDANDAEHRFFVYCKNCKREYAIKVKFPAVVEFCEVEFS